MDCSVGYDKRRDKYGMRKGNTLKVEVVGENTKRRRLMVVALFIPKLANTQQRKKQQLPISLKSELVLSTVEGISSTTFYRSVVLYY
jgi:hypothetical protein